MEQIGCHWRNFGCRGKITRKSVRLQMEVLRGVLFAVDISTVIANLSVIADMWLMNDLYE